VLLHSISKQESFEKQPEDQLWPTVISEVEVFQRADDALESMGEVLESVSKLRLGRIQVLLHQT
jgi:hypothetical protein